MEIRDRSTIAWVGEEGVEMEGEKGGCHVREEGAQDVFRGPIKIRASPDSGQ